MDTLSCQEKKKKNKLILTFSQTNLLFLDFWLIEMFNKSSYRKHLKKKKIIILFLIFYNLNFQNELGSRVKYGELLSLRTLKFFYKNKPVFLYVIFIMFIVFKTKYNLRSIYHQIIVYEFVPYEHLFSLSKETVPGIFLTPKIDWSNPRWKFNVFTLFGIYQRT